MLMLLSYQGGSLTRALLTTSPSLSFSLFIAPSCTDTALHLSTKLTRVKSPYVPNFAFPKPPNRSLHHGVAAWL